MDPATHGLLGASVAQMVGQKRIPKKIWLVGLLAGMAPDLDILIRSSTNPLLFVYFHRHFTHSLIFIPLGGLIVGAFCLLFSAQLRQQWKLVLLAAICGYGTHCLLDACTSYGTLLFWPFSMKRVAWDSIAIIDGIFTLCLFVGVIAAAITEKARYAVVGLVLALSYLGFGAYQHQQMLDVQHELQVKRNENVMHSRVFPHLSTLFEWRSMYETKGVIHYDEISAPLFHRPFTKHLGIVASIDGGMLPVEIRSNKKIMHDFHLFDWFSDGFLALSTNKPLVLADGRFTMFSGPNIYGMWAIEIPSNPNVQHVIWRTVVNLPKKAQQI